MKVERCSWSCSIIPKLKRICSEVLLNGSGESEVNVKHEIKLKEVTQLQVNFLRFAYGASIPGTMYEPGFHI